MNMHPVLFFFFLSAMCGGHTGLVHAKVNIYTGAEGQTGSILCSLRSSGNWKFFCKDECKEEDILVKTDGVEAQSGRYSVRSKETSSKRGTVSVTIASMTKSDAGRYRCGLGGTSGPEKYSDFKLRVVNESPLDGISHVIRTDTIGEAVEFGCRDTVYGAWKFFCRGECNTEEDILIETKENKTTKGRYTIEYKHGSAFGLHVTIQQLTKSDTGMYKCGYGRALSPDSYKTLPILVIEAPVPTTAMSPSSSSGGSTPSSVPSETTDHPTDYFLPLVVCASLVFVQIIGCLLFLCIRKTRRNSGLSTRGNEEGVPMEVREDYKNCSVAVSGEEGVYESLDPATRDTDQTYSNL